MPTAFDTNVVVRVLVGDDPVQTRKAERAFVEHAKTDGVFVSLVVLAEVVWVLSAAYRWDRSLILGRIGQLVRTRGVQVEDLDVVESALERFRAGTADFSDYLIAAKASGIGAELLTFDRRLAREDGVRLL